MSRIAYSLDELLAYADSPLCKPPESLKPLKEWIGVSPTVRQHRSSFTKVDGEPPDDLKDSQDKLTKDKDDDILLRPPKISFEAHANNKTAKNSDGVLFEPDSSRSATVTTHSRNDRHRSSPIASFNSSFGQGSKFAAKYASSKSNTSATARRFYKDELSVEGKNLRVSRSTVSDDNMIDSPFQKEHPGQSMSRREEDTTSWRYRDPERERIRERDRRDKNNHAHGSSFPREEHVERFGNSGRYNEKVPEWMDSTVDMRDATQDFQKVVSDTDLSNSAHSSRSQRSQVASRQEVKDGPGRHSVEEFQAWKEKMKAADQAGKGKFDLTAENNKDALFIERDISPPLPETGVDKLFGMFGNQLTPYEVQELSKAAETTSKLRSSGDSSNRSSRFSSFFKPEVRDPRLQERLHTEAVNDAMEKPQLTQVSSRFQQTSHSTHMSTTVSEGSSIVVDRNVDTASPASSDTDREGFKKIMAMLGNSKPPLNRSPSGSSSSVPTPAPESQKLANRPPPQSQSQTVSNTQNFHLSHSSKKSTSEDIATKPAMANDIVSDDRRHNAGTEDSNVQFLLKLMNQKPGTQQISHTVNSSSGSRTSTTTLPPMMISQQMKGQYQQAAGQHMVPPAPHMSIQHWQMNGPHQIEPRQLDPRSLPPPPPEMVGENGSTFIASNMTHMNYRNDGMMMPGHPASTRDGAISEISSMRPRRGDRPPNAFYPQLPNFPPGEAQLHMAPPPGKFPPQNIPFFGMPGNLPPLPPGFPMQAMPPPLPHEMRLPSMPPHLAEDPRMMLPKGQPLPSPSRKSSADDRSHYNRG
ncbi:uncharacterized protein V1510DRAFT_419871 [Dipodascopsis tothii]|uniref:uncharacterized protein n=1 Tax=Dipodascopsis tothii TaxID=44089 RepID=UPI0034CECACD